MQLPRTIPDRILYGIACLFLVALFAPFLLGVYYWDPDDLPMQITKYVIRSDFRRSVHRADHRPDCRVSLTLKSRTAGGVATGLPQGTDSSVTRISIC